MAGHPNSLKNLKPFQKGNPGGGRPKSFLTGQQASGIAQKMSRLTKSQLTEIIENPRSEQIEVALARAWLKAGETGDMAAINQILDRAVGKIPNVNENTNLTANLDKQDLIDRVPVETVIELVKALPESSE